MTTARNLITRAMQINGVLTKGESPSGDEASDGLSSLNALLGSWSNDGLLIYERLSESFPLVSGQRTYTIGPSGNFNTSAPLQILTAFTRIDTLDYEMSIIPDTAYDSIAYKDIQTGIPEALVYQQGAPLGTITIYPVPTQGTLHIRSEKQLSQFATLDSVVELPAGWERALVYNLALEIASEYGQPVNEAVYAIAMDALSKIKIAVARNKTMDAYPYDAQDNNIYSGWYN